MTPDEEWKMRHQIVKARLMGAIQSSGMTVAQVAQKAAINRITLYMLMEEKQFRFPRLDTAIGLAHALEISLDWLCGLEG